MLTLDSQVLYPPIIYLKPTGRTDQVTVHGRQLAFTTIA